MGCQNAGWGFFAAACRQVAACKRCFACLFSKVHLLSVQLYICRLCSMGFCALYSTLGNCVACFSLPAGGASVNTVHRTVLDEMGHKDMKKYRVRWTQPTYTCF